VFVSGGGDHYDLVQLHFHKPSEEAIDGRHYAMVAHFVHRNAKGDLAVVAVLLKAGADNPLIDQSWRNIPSTEEHEETLHAVSISPAQLLPANRSYLTYKGSLTTPPCTEGVRWFVLRTPTSIGVKQILTFGKLYQMSARPVQPVGKRGPGEQVTLAGKAQALTLHNA
jgi:carbonic anhydrase